MVFRLVRWLSQRCNDRSHGACGWLATRHSWRFLVHRRPVPAFRVSELVRAGLPVQLPGLPRRFQSQPVASKETNHWIFFCQDAVTRNLQTNVDGHLWYYDYSASQWTLAQDTQETPSYEVEINLSPSIGGTVTGAGSYEEGFTATLTATPSEGYLFTGWSGDLQSSSPTLTFTVTQNSALTATFEKDSVKQIIKSLFD